MSTGDASGEPIRQDRDECGAVGVFLRVSVGPAYFGQLAITDKKKADGSSGASSSPHFDHCSFYSILANTSIAILAIPDMRCSVGTLFRTLDIRCSL